ncbi:MAG: type I 3-dehydroquinate dehydratase [Liquorilactobacillus ghanensis]|uniref:type I 3-dehydroquinate dehydratase n=1 Tax=Liquorilactobacillus ghanensis TaxID=399370 RepID=UPI0039E87658
MKSVKIGNLTLGNGKPKIAVSLTGKNQNEMLQQAQQIAVVQPDLVEWRLDYFQDVLEITTVSQLAAKLRQIIPIPLLLTFRTQAEGGVQPLSTAQYFILLRQLIDQQLGDAIDIEVARSRQNVIETIQAAHQQNLPVILSNHDFQATPTEAKLVARLTLMNDLQADIAKIAVMPHSAADVLTLLTATHTAAEYLPLPLITMAMGDLGKITRLSGELFGSVLTFGSVGSASAPGQIPAQTLRSLLNELQLDAQNK